MASSPSSSRRNGRPASSHAGFPCLGVTGDHHEQHHLAVSALLLVGTASTALAGITATAVD
jgi:hypothetical protein